MLGVEDLGHQITLQIDRGRRVGLGAGQAGRLDDQHFESDFDRMVKLLPPKPTRP